MTTNHCPSKDWDSHYAAMDAQAAAEESHDALTARVAELEAALRVTRADAEKFARAHNDAVEALVDAWAYMEHNNIAEHAQTQGSVESVAYRSVRAVLAKGAA